MGILSVEDLEAGMVIAEDVRDRSGRLLIGKGAELSDKTLRVLKTWGIIEVEVEGADSVDGDNAIEALDSDTVEGIKDQLTERFRHNQIDHVVISTLYELVFEHEAMKIVEGEE